MVEAMEAVGKGNTSINRAAVTFGVPRTTLKDRLSGRVLHGTKPGPQCYLDKKEEALLADHLVEAAQIGYGKTRKEVKSIVEQVAKENAVNRSNRVSDGWWRRFLERQPQLSLRRGDATAHVRMDATNKEAITKYYDLLEDTLNTNILGPGQIYNMDESGMPLDPRPPNIIAKRGQKKVRYRVSGKKDQITVVGCANATGQAIPPMVIFEGKYLNHQWTTGEVPSTYYGMSEKGWTDQELFRHWLKDHFLKHAVAARRLLLLLDGHSSHYEPQTIELAKENDVIIFCLPPHTTQDSQPLDTTVFGPLKRHWSEVCHEFLQSNPGKVVNKYNFSGLFAQAWLKALTPTNIVSGFRKCGVHPFNRNAIMVLDDKRVETSENDKGAKTDKGVKTGNAPQGSTTDVQADNAAQGSSSDVQADNAAQESTTGSFQGTATANPAALTFTAEETEKFETRYEEGYDLRSDDRYVAWLDPYHPDGDTESPLTSLLREFSDVAPLSPVGTSDDTLTLTPTTAAASTLCVAPTASTTVSSATPTSGTRTTTSVDKVSPVARYLTLLTAPKKNTPVNSSKFRAMTGARVLTSSECLAIIREKELQKKKMEERGRGCERRRRKNEKKRNRKRQKNEPRKLRNEHVNKLKRRSRKRRKQKKQKHEHKKKPKQVGSLLLQCQENERTCGAEPMKQDRAVRLPD